ncbi:PREDICTED: kynurenine formamidase [Myotis brandtii]|uniref:kynurenine formamidase n=1 Tax=Myotis brandtii TaxID=109478 RepID=UPI0003BB86DE|nr:PREDICTED: kynurenine formamidase [Myotis brandtii]
MDAQREDHQGEAPWRKMSGEELEKQYTPSRWTVLRGAEEALRTYSQIGSEVRRPTLYPLSHTESRYVVAVGTEAQSPPPPATRLRGDGGSGGRAPRGHSWSLCSKDESAYVAAPLTGRGAAVVVVGYTLAPKGTLDQMVDQVARSIAFLQKRFPCNEGIYLCGHSAGAQLAAMMLLANWTERGVTPNLKGFSCFLLSGVYDLEPIVHTSVNAPLRLTPEGARRNSPQWHLEAASAKPRGPACPVLVIVGQHDSPEFHRQSREFYQTLCRAGWRASYEDLQDVDHFEMVWKLNQQDYALIQIILKTIFQES